MTAIAVMSIVITGMLAWPSRLAIETFERSLDQYGTRRGADDVPRRTPTLEASTSRSMSGEELSDSPRAQTRPTGAAAMPSPTPSRLANWYFGRFGMCHRSGGGVVRRRWRSGVHEYNISGASDRKKVRRVRAAALVESQSTLTLRPGYLLRSGRPSDAKDDASPIVANVRLTVEAAGDESSRRLTLSHVVDTSSGGWAVAARPAVGFWWLEGMLWIEGRGAVPLMFSAVPCLNHSQTPMVTRLCEVHEASVDVTSLLSLSPPSDQATPILSLRLLVSELFDSYLHVDERRTGVALPFSSDVDTQTLVDASWPVPAPFGGDAAALDDSAKSRVQESSPSDLPLRPAHWLWRDTGVDAADHKRSWLKGYWLPVRGEAKDASVATTRPDILGRVNFRRRFVLADTGGVATAAGATSDGAEDSVMSRLVAPRCDRQCWITLLQGTEGASERSSWPMTVYFMGDSHMRILYYGLLSVLGIAYPPDKVWRGDRTDHVPKGERGAEAVDGGGGKVSFVASYFLNLTRPSAAAALAETTGSRQVYYVVGVGQHHASGCWPLKAHRRAVAEALDELLLRPASPPPSAASPRRIAWLGTPAHPVNRHLFLPKPIGQARTDCRNNARHLLYNLEELEAVANVSRYLHAQNHTARVRFVDAFGASYGMHHTSLDGAHYYTWVRDAWLDAVADTLRSLQQPRRPTLRGSRRA